MMKNLIRFSVLVIAALLFATCAAGTLVDSPTGSITFAFPSGALARGIGDETYEVAIYYGLDLYEAAPDITGDELSFADLPTGDVRIIVARGTADDGFFYSEAYGQLFITIVAGDNGPYDLDLDPSDFAWVESLKGSDVVGLAKLEEGEEDDTFYAATAGSLVKGSYLNGTFSNVVDGPPVPAGIAVNSISVGKVYNGVDIDEQVWVNGTWNESAGGGIMPWVDDDLDYEPITSFSSGFGNPKFRKDETAEDLSVEYSGAFEAPGDEGGLAIVFQRDGGMGGVYLAADEFDVVEYPAYERPWIVDEINFEELLADVVEEGTKFVKDLIVSSESSAAYVVTSIATLKASEEVISSTSDFEVEDIMSSDAIAFAPDLGSAIVSIDVAGSGPDEVIYLGTENGLFSGPSSSTPAEFFDGGSASLIGGTAGYYVKLVSASPDGDLVAFAARRGGSELLIIVDIEADDAVDLRDLQGLPGNRLHNLVWLDNSTLAVSGDHGLAVIETGTLF